MVLECDECGKVESEVNRFFKREDSFLCNKCCYRKDALRNSRSNEHPPLKGFIESFKDDIEEVINDLKDDVLEGVEEEFPEESSDRNLLLDDESILERIDISEELKEKINENNLEVLEESADFHSSKVEAELDKTFGDMHTKVLEELGSVEDTFTYTKLQMLGSQHAESIEDSIQGLVRTEVFTGMKNGEGVDKVSERIDEKLDGVSKSKSEEVARTETLSASRRGSQAVAEQSDVVSGKEWIATDDNRVRPWHDAMDGVVVEVSESFSVPGGFEGQPSDYPRQARVVGDDQPYNCFDDKTEVLTEDGWKLFQNLDDERVYSFDMDEKELVLEEPIDYIEKDVDEILRYEGESVSIGATGKHDMIVSYGNGWSKRELGDIKENNNSYIRVPCKTGGVGDGVSDSFVLDEVNGEFEYQDELYKGEWSEKSISLKDWSRFLGIYLAEGWTNTDDKGYTVYISATKQEQRDKVMHLLDSMGFDYSSYDDVIVVNNKQLAVEIESLSKGASNKVIPDYVFNWSAEIINVFLDWYTLGDGNITSYGVRRIWTTSEEMSDQLQHLFILTGSDASVIKSERDKMMVLGQECNAEDLYCVQERKSDSKSISQRNNEIKKVSYDGKVRCVTVSNGTLIVRRNKKTLLVGNCRCSQAPVVDDRFKDEDSFDELKSLDSIKVSRDISDRQYEVWKEHSRDGESFEDMMKRVKDGFSNNKAPSELGISKSSYYNWLKDLGIKS